MVWRQSVIVSNLPCLIFLLQGCRPWLGSGLLRPLPGVQSHWINFMRIAPLFLCLLLSGIKERSARRNQEIHSKCLAIMSSSGKYPRKVSVKFKKLEVRERERGWRRRARKHTPTNSRGVGGWVFCL